MAWVESSDEVPTSQPTDHGPPPARKRLLASLASGSPWPLPDSIFRHLPPLSYITLAWPPPHPLPLPSSSMRNPDPLGTSDGADLTSIGDHHHSWIQHNNHLPLSTPLPPTPPQQQQQQQQPLALPLQPLPLPLPPPPLLPPQQPPPRSLESSLQHPSHDPPPTGHAPSPPRLAAPSQPGTVTDTLLGSPELLVLMNGQPHTPPTANSAMADSMHGQFKRPHPVIKPSVGTDTTTDSSSSATSE